MHALKWIASSLTLLVLGFLAYVYASFLVAQVQGSASPQMPAALGVYALVVLAKGLLPALLLALGLGLLIERSFGLTAPRALFLGLGACAATASLVMAVAVLPLALPVLPVVKYTGLANLLRTAAEMTGAVWLALWIPRWLMARRARPVAPAEEETADRETALPLGPGSSRLLAAGVVAACLLGALVGMRGAARHEPALPAPEASTALPAPPSPAPFDAPSPAARAPEPAPAAAGPEAPLTGLPLRLLAATPAEAEGDTAVAAITDTEDGAFQVMHEGDAFLNHPQALLTEIRADHVLLDNDGRTERLLLDPAFDPADEGISVTDVISGQEREQRRRHSERLRELVDENTIDGVPVGGFFVDGVLAEVTPYVAYGEDGEIAGVGIDDPQSGSLFDELGLREGDVVTTINGIPLDQKVRVTSLLEGLTGGPIEMGVQHVDGSTSVIETNTGHLVSQLLE